MRVVVCPDSFKGSLTSVQAAEAVARGVRSALGGSPIEIALIPLADGGEGTVEALVRATGGRVIPKRAHDPLMREIDSFFGMLGDSAAAVVEMAAASGLCLLSAAERDPLTATTYGVGELLMAAAEAGADTIVVGIGGSATNDGGAGAVQAMGVRFLDDSGVELPLGGAALSRLRRIDMSGFRFPVGRVKVEVACDVDNPLTGPSGASAVYGPQKGATPEMVAQLDSALLNYAKVIESELDRNVDGLPGAGAAGGLGAGLAAFLDARLRSGIDIVLDAVGFDRALDGADLVITGEGRIDEQTSRGKTIGGVLRRASSAGVPMVAIAGSVTGDIGPLVRAGLTEAVGLVSESVTAERAIAQASCLVESAAADVTRRHLSKRAGA